MSAKDKLALDKGAAASRKAESESKTVKLDGTLAGVVKQITRLHTEILATPHNLLEKFIRVGELLHRVRDSRQGKWLEWIGTHMPFDVRTAQRYVKCHVHRDEFRAARVTSLTEACALLSAPLSMDKRLTNDATRMSHDSLGNGEAVGNVSTADTITSREPPEQSLEPDEQPTPTPRGKSRKQIEKSLQRISEREQATEKQADAELSAIIEKLTGKVRAQWLEFPGHLAAHGMALSELAKRLQLNTPRA